MYLSALDLERRLPRRAASPLPAGARSCPADEAIDEQAALLYSPEAPVAGVPGAHCDHRAVWAMVPRPAPAALSLFCFFHGMNNFVTASAASPGGRQPGWTRRRPTPLVAGGAFAAGPKYGLDAAAQASPHRPVTIVPEVAFGASPRFWAVTRAGRLATDPDAFGRLADDCLARLTRLRRPSGTAYLAGAAAARPPQRLYLSGHSAGGVPVTHAAHSAMAQRLPTDLWLLDATYNGGLNGAVAAFARRWAGPVTRRPDRPGPSPRAGRLVIVTIPGTPTEPNADAIVARLRRPSRDGTRAVPPLSAARFERGRLLPVGRGPLPPSPDIVVIAVGTPMADIEAILRRTPIVLIKTRVSHDRIPREFTPILLRTAAGP